MSEDALNAPDSHSSPDPRLLQARLAEISRAQAAEARAAAEASGAANGGANARHEWAAGCVAFDEAEAAFRRADFVDAAGSYGWSAGAFLRARHPPHVAAVVPTQPVAPRPLAAALVPPRGRRSRQRSGAPLVGALAFAALLIAIALRAPEPGSAAVVALPPPSAVLPLPPLALTVETASRSLPAEPAELAAPADPVAPVAPVVEAVSPPQPPPLELPPPAALGSSLDDAPPVVSDRPLGEWLRRYAVAWGRRDVVALQRLGVLTSPVETDRLAAQAEVHGALRATVANVVARKIANHTVVSFDRALAVADAGTVTDHLTFVLQPGPKGLVAFVPGRDNAALARWLPPAEQSNTLRP